MGGSSDVRSDESSYTSFIEVGNALNEGQKTQHLTTLVGLCTYSWKCCHASCH